MKASIERAADAWLIGDDDEVIVIDPGQDADQVLDKIGERDVLAVICTHGHATHVAAAREVADPDEAPIALHRSDRLHWRESYRKDDPDIEMEDGGFFEVSDTLLEVIHTPGHTAGSVSLYCEDLGVVFTGDALIASGPAPHEGIYPDFPRQLNSIGEHLLPLAGETRVLPGHGDEFTIGDASKHFEGWVIAGPPILVDPGVEVEPDDEAGPDDEAEPDDAAGPPAEAEPAAQSEPVIKTVPVLKAEPSAEES
jgi:glyoxylase-like metal-dependent hydrolase (beta-lactamase superfamily II)